MSYPIMLAINDRNGNEDRLTAATFGADLDPDLECEGDILDGEPFLIVGDRWLILNPHGTPTMPPSKDCELFKFTRRKRHVGNVCWDQFECAPVYACMLANYLSRLPHWSKTVWCDQFGAMWDRKEFDSLAFLLAKCEVCGKNRRPLWQTGSMGVLDGRFCSEECLQAYVESK